MEYSIKVVRYQTNRQSNEICNNTCVSFELKANNKTYFTEMSLISELFTKTCSRTILQKIILKVNISLEKDDSLF